VGDLQLVDRLARLQLTARRRGYRLALVDPPETLRELIELIGLSGVLGPELQRQPEEREEHGGVEEERQLGDPPVH
jgi:hypothetical protein